MSTIKKRLSSHKANFKRWKNGTANNCKSFTLFEKYGFDNCPIELVEHYPCETKKELLIKEQWYMDNNDCINEIASYTSREEYLESKKKWHLEHKEEQREPKKQWNKSHKELICENKRKHYHANKEAILEKQKEKIVCECGRECRKSDISRHRRSEFHLAHLNLTI